MDKTQLADFLRKTRARVLPHEVGLATTQRRRQIPGLRREEIAALADVSVDYYTRMEQGRATSPSRRVLISLADALRLSSAERNYLLRLGGASPDSVSSTRQVPPRIIRLIEQMNDVAVTVIDTKYFLLAWNDLANQLFGGLDAVPDEERNVLWWLFRGAHTDLSEAANRQFARQCVADLRASHVELAGDPELETLLARLRRHSTRFAELWNEHEVGVPTSFSKNLPHETYGTIEIECQLLQVPDRNLRLLLYTPKPPHSSLRDLLNTAQPVGG